jgi:hypothetical protein
MLNIRSNTKLMRRSVSVRACGNGKRPPASGLVQLVFAWQQKYQYFRHALFLDNRRAVNIVNFSQNPDGDLGDWFSEECPQTHPYVQNAFACAGQDSDISATSPEGINLDVIATI